MTTTERAKALLAGITPGEWAYDGESEITSRHKTEDGTCIHVVLMATCEDGYCSTSANLRDADAAFIVAASSLVRGLCEDVERLSALVERLGGDNEQYHSSLEIAGFRIEEAKERADELERQRDNILGVLLDSLAEWDGSWMPPAKMYDGGIEYTEQEARALWLEWAAGAAQEEQQ